MHNNQHTRALYWGCLWCVCERLACCLRARINNSSLSWWWISLIMKCNFTANLSPPPPTEHTSKISLARFCLCGMNWIRVWACTIYIHNIPAACRSHARSFSPGSLIIPLVFVCQVRASAAWGAFRGARNRCTHCYSNVSNMSTSHRLWGDSCLQNTDNTPMDCISLFFKWRGNVRLLFDYAFPEWILVAKYICWFYNKYYHSYTMGTNK